MKLITLEKSRMLKYTLHKKGRHCRVIISDIQRHLREKNPQLVRFARGIEAWNQHQAASQTDRYSCRARQLLFRVCKSISFQRIMQQHKAIEGPRRFMRAPRPPDFK